VSYSIILSILILPPSPSKDFWGFSVTSCLENSGAGLVPRSVALARRDVLTRTSWLLEVAHGNPNLTFFFPFGCAYYDPLCFYGPGRLLRSAWAKLSRLVPCILLATVIWARRLTPRLPFPAFRRRFLSWLRVFSRDHCSFLSDFFIAG